MRTPHSCTNFGKVQLERGQDGHPELRLGVKSWPVTRCMTFRRHWTLLGLSFFVCKLGITTRLTSWGHYED